MKQRLRLNSKFEAAFFFLGGGGGGGGGEILNSEILKIFTHDVNMKKKMPGNHPSPLDCL